MWESFAVLLVTICCQMSLRKVVWDLPCKWCRKHINPGRFLASTFDIGFSCQFALSALVKGRNNTGLCKPRNTAVGLSGPGRQKELGWKSAGGNSAGSKVVHCQQCWQTHEAAEALEVEATSGHLLLPGWWCLPSKADGFSYECPSFDTTQQITERPLRYVQWWLQVPRWAEYSRNTCFSNQQCFL